MLFLVSSFFTVHLFLLNSYVPTLTPLHLMVSITVITKYKLKRLKTVLPQTHSFEPPPSVHPSKRPPRFTKEMLKSSVN